MLRLEGRGRHVEPGRAAADATVGVLVLANFGAAADLRIDGVPVGRSLERPEGARRDAAGSCIVVVATDAPLGPAELQRVARRAGLGLARTGSVAHHASGEIFLAFAAPGAAAAPRSEPPSGRALDPIFAATVEATEEAVLNALWHGVDTRGRDGRIVHALPRDEVLAILAAHRPSAP